MEKVAFGLSLFALLLFGTGCGSEATQEAVEAAIAEAQPKEKEIAQPKEEEAPESRVAAEQPAEHAEEVVAQPKEEPEIEEGPYAGYPIAHTLYWDKDLGPAVEKTKKTTTIYMEGRLFEFATLEGGAARKILYFFEEGCKGQPYGLASALGEKAYVSHDWKIWEPIGEAVTAPQTIVWEMDATSGSCRYNGSGNNSFMPVQDVGVLQSRYNPMIVLKD